MSKAKVDTTNIGGNYFSTTGELTKLGGGIKTWKRRVFGLHKPSKTLYYFKTADDLKEHVKSQKKNFKGTIELKDAKLYISDYQMDQQFCAEIDTPSRIHFIVADSREALLVWIAAIGGAGVQLKTPVPVAALAAAGVQCALAKHGFLQKRGQWNVSWQIRFFRTAIKDGKHVLHYFDYLEEHQLRGTIPLTGSEITELKEETDLQIKTKERPYILRSKDEAERKEWLAVLKALAKGQLWPDGVNPTPVTPTSAAAVPASPGKPKTPTSASAASAAAGPSAADAEAKRKADAERAKFEEEKRQFEVERQRMEQMRAQMAAEKKKMEEEQATLRASMSAIEKQRSSMGGGSIGGGPSPTHSGSVGAAHNAAAPSPLQAVSEAAPTTYAQADASGAAPMAVSPVPQVHGVPPPAPAEAGLAPLPDGWSEYTAPGGQKYYHNVHTQVSTFERPA